MFRFPSTENNISFGISGSFSTISKYTAAVANNGNPTNEFLAVDAMFKYDLSDVFTLGKFEPFIGIGPGYTWFEDQEIFYWEPSCRCKLLGL